MADASISWGTLISNKNEFHTSIDGALTNLNLETTNYVRFSIANLQDFLSNLAEMDVENVDIYLVKYPGTDGTYPNRISVALAGAGLIGTQPSNALPWNIGEVNP